jgi:hypothetical protein
MSDETTRQIEQAIEQEKDNLRFMYPDMEESLIDEIELLAERLAGQFGRYPGGVPEAMRAVVNGIAWQYRGKANSGSNEISADA